MLVHFQSVPPFSSTSRVAIINFVPILLSFFFCPIFSLNDISNTVLIHPFIWLLILPQIIFSCCILPTWSSLPPANLVSFFSPHLLQFFNLPDFSHLQTTLGDYSDSSCLLPDYFPSARSDLSMRARQSLRPPAIYRPPSISCHSNLCKSCASL